MILIICPNRQFFELVQKYDDENLMIIILCGKGKQGRQATGKGDGRGQGRQARAKGEGDRLRARVTGKGASEGNGRLETPSNKEFKNLG